MIKLRSELETVYTKQGLADKVNSIQDGWGTIRDTKAKQGAQKVHQRNVNELGMSPDKPEETVIQKCRRCGTEKKTTHVFIDEGKTKIVLDTCKSRKLTTQCQHVMQVQSGIKPQPPTISRRRIVERSRAAAVVSSSDEPSSSGGDTNSLPVTRTEFEGLYTMVQKAQSDLSLIEKEILPKKRKLRLRLTHNALGHCSAGEVALSLFAL